MAPARQPSTRNAGAAVLAGLACGGLWVLGVVTILGVVRPGAMTVPLALVVWTVTGLVMTIVLYRPGTPRQAWGRAALTIGLHALGLPIAAAIAFGAAGASPPAETADPGLSVQIRGVRLVGTPATVRLGVAGFVFGLLLVSIGDRALRRGPGGRATPRPGADRRFR